MPSVLWCYLVTTCRAGSALTRLQWKPPCSASYFCGAPTNLSLHQFRNSSVANPFSIYFFFSRNCQLLSFMCIFNNNKTNNNCYCNNCNFQEAFWCLVMICNNYIPGYYSPKLVSCCQNLWGFLWLLPQRAT